jgi:hypothetical protein
LFGSFVSSQARSFPPPTDLKPINAGFLQTLRPAARGGTQRTSPLQLYQRQVAGLPLGTWAVLLAAIRGTTTGAGLTVEAVLHPARCQIGWSVTAPRTSKREVVL